MTFNWKVKIGSLLTAWHRYQVMDLLFPRVSNTGTTMAPQSPITACPFVRWRGSGLLRIIIFVGVLISLKLTTALGRGRHSFSSLRMGSGDGSRFLIQFGFMFSCFLRSRGRGEGNNIYATAGWSLYSAQWWWWTALRTNRPSHSHRSSTQKREILWFWIYWWSGCECDVYLASYSQRVLDVWSDHFRHIVYCGDCFWHSFTMLRHGATDRELISISQYSSVSGSSWGGVRGAIFIMTMLLLWYKTEQTPFDFNRFYYPHIIMIASKFVYFHEIVSCSEHQVCGLW